jgi:Flp pilus assembly protein TadD
MKRLLVAGGLAVAFLLAAGEGRAQGTGTVRGKVLDEKGQPLEGALVTMEFQGGVTRKMTTKTNKKGDFTQVGLPPGIYRFTATREGYQGAYVDARIGLGQPTDLPELKLPSAAGRGGAGGTSAEIEKSNAELRELVKQAAQFTQEKKYDEAIAAYQSMLAKNVSAPEEVHYRIGLLQGEKKDYAAAEAAFLKALEIKPGHPGSQLELANVYQLTGQKEKAAEAMAKAQAAGGTDANVQFSTGVLHINNGRYEEAQAAFKKTIEIDPSFAEAYYHLGTIALNQNNTPEAIANLEKYLSMNPSNPTNVKTATDLLKALKPQPK